MKHKRGFKALMLTAGILGSIYLNSCATVNKNLENRQKEISIADNLISSKIEFVGFDEFYPDSIDIPEDYLESVDLLFKDYITGESDLEGIISNCGLSLDRYFVDKDVISQLNYRRADSFRFKSKKSIEEIVNIAQQGGHDLEKLKNLSIHEAVLLSGEITAKKLKFMPLDYKDNWSTFRTNFLMTFKYLKNPDQILSEEISVCGQFAQLNIAIFNYFKTINSNLKESVMTYKIDNVFHNPKIHAWNQVITPVKEGEKIKFIQTDVDASRLSLSFESYKEEDKNLGNKIESKTNCYNALFDDYYDSGLFYLYRNMARFYEALGNKARTKSQFGIFSEISEEQRKVYLDDAFELRYAICNNLVLMLDNLSASNSKEKKKSKEICASRLGDSFKMLLEDFTGERISEIIKKKEGNSKMFFDSEKYASVVRKYELISRYLYVPIDESTKKAYFLLKKP